MMMMEILTVILMIGMMMMITLIPGMEWVFVNQVDNIWHQNKCILHDNHDNDNDHMN